MLRQDIYTTVRSAAAALQRRERERERERRGQIFFVFSSGSTTGGATANRRVAPFLLGREYIRNKRFIGIFPSSSSIYIFLRFLCWVGRRRRRRPFWDSTHRSHLAIVYISHVPSSFIRKKKKENDRREYRRGLVLLYIFFYFFLSFFFLLMYRAPSCVHLRFSFASDATTDKHQRPSRNKEIFYSILSSSVLFVLFLYVYYSLQGCYV